VNGEKLWCTNGSIAHVVTLIARVPVKQCFQAGQQVWMPVSDEKEATRWAHTAFILEMNDPDVTIQQRCQFAGCRGIENAHMTFTDVRIPVENVIRIFPRVLDEFLALTS
jgi:alkylation response protein AidB-like acyl-CoA dehydrogenase